jgi:inner membrane protein
MEAMDDLTHALAGTLLARAQPSKAKGLVLACVAGALIPDADILLTLWGGDFYLTEHRGFTHSLLGLLPMSFLAAGIVWWLLRKTRKRASFESLWGMAFAGVVSHILLDWCTSWGTMLLWPNRTRFALDNLFIIDLWYGVLLAAPLVLGAFLKEKRIGFARAGILLVLGYHFLAAVEHHRALQAVVKDRPNAWYAAFPEPFSPFRWSAFNRGEGLLRNARLDFLKSSGPLYWKEWKEPPLTWEMKTAMEVPAIKTYLWFARVPLWEEEKKPEEVSVIRFWDERFSSSLRGRREMDASKRFGAAVTLKEGKVLP